MTNAKATDGPRKGPGLSGTSRRTRLAAAFITGPVKTMPKGVSNYRFSVSTAESKAITGNPERIKALIKAYGQAVVQSKKRGEQVSFRVDIDPEGEAIVTTFEDAAVPDAPALEGPMLEEGGAPDPELEAALDAARERGRLRAAEILSGDDMLSADDLAKVLGMSRMTVNTKRQNGQLLGLDGAKRGYRFPLWQIDGDGKPYSLLPELHELLGGPWAVYRFLVQPHGALEGMTGREALERGKDEAVLDAAEGAGRDFR